MLPPSASELIRITLQQVSAGSGVAKAALGILGALWSASSGVTAVMQSLNVAYRVKEERPLWKRRAIAVGLTLALVVLVLVALALTLFGGKAADLAQFAWLWAGDCSCLARCSMACRAGVHVFGFFDHLFFAPDLEKPEWHWITPGAALGVILWLAASYGIKLYLRFFNSYNKTYGSVGAIIVLLLWLYITGFCIMVGGEVNSEIGRAIDSQAGRETQRPMDPGRRVA